MSQPLEATTKTCVVILLRHLLVRPGFNSGDTCCEIHKTNAYWAFSVCGLFYQVGIYNFNLSNQIITINLISASSALTLSAVDAISVISFLCHFLACTIKRWIKEGMIKEEKKSPCIHLNYPLSLRSFLLSPVIMLHTSHFNTGLSALSERCNLVLVMKTYIPAPLPERRPH